MNGPLKLLILLTVMSIVTVVGAAAAAPPHPAPEDKCPVCGMFVAKYPDWVASLTFANEEVFFFDGVKDMFKYIFDLAKYYPGQSRQDIADVHVTDYYDMKIIDGRQAFYVLGSDVYGPMGKELIPLASEEDARQFLADHHGQVILRFEQITPAIIKRLD